MSRFSILLMILSAMQVGGRVMPPMGTTISMEHMLDPSIPIEELQLGGLDSMVDLINGSPNEELHSARVSGTGLAQLRRVQDADDEEDLERYSSERHGYGLSYDLDESQVEEVNDADPEDRITFENGTSKIVLIGDLEADDAHELRVCVAETLEDARTVLDVDSGESLPVEEPGAAGREGTFVIQHGGIVDGETPTAFGSIVPGSGTGDLEGIRGTAVFSHDATGAHLTLTYTISRVSSTVGATA